MILVTGHMGYIGAKLFARLDATGVDIRAGKDILTCSLPPADLVYHLAAQSDVMASWDDPIHDMKNLQITARIVKEYPNAKIVYANSCGAVDPETPYGFSKWACAEYLRRFHGNVVNCIFPNVYGDGGRSVIDVFQNRDSVVIYGDGTQTRSFVHVHDIVEGLLKAQHWAVGDYFMGTGKSVTVGDLAKGKNVTYLPARNEPKFVNVPNTTPDWEPRWV